MLTLLSLLSIARSNARAFVFKTACHNTGISNQNIVSVWRKKRLPRLYDGDVFLADDFRDHVAGDLS